MSSPGSVRLFVCLLAGIGAAAMAVVTPHADQQIPTPFRIGTDLITVDVSVLDGDRLPIRGLTVDDFTVLEDGLPRPIVAFSVVDVPTMGEEDGDVSRASWMRAAPRDVVANDLPAEGRLVVILFDRSIPAGGQVATARGIAAAAVDRLGPGDVAAVVRTSGFADNGRVQGFTADRGLLMAAIDSTVTGEPLIGLNPSPIPGSDASTPGCHCGLCVFETLNNVIDAMNEAPRRRKVLLFIGSAITMPSAVGNDRCYSPVQDARARLDRRLELANVTIHSIDPSGVITTAPRGAFVVLPGAPAAAATPPPGTYSQADAGRLDSLRVLPEQTGGRLVANTNVPGEHLPAIFEETRSYYLLGFEPSTAPDDRFRRIDVRVNQRAAHVRARGGYIFDRPASAAAGVDDDADAMSELVAALRAQQPRQGLPLVMNVTLFPGAPTTSIPVAVLVGTSSTRQDGPQRFAMAAGAFDLDGRPVAVHMQTIEVSGARPRAEIDGLNARLDLPPGRYEVRAAVRDERTRAVGSVFSFLDVPENADLIALSGLVFRRDQPASPPTAGPLEGLVAFMPTVERRFTSADRISVFARVYSPVGAGPVSVRAVVVDEAGTRRFERMTTIDAQRLTNGIATHVVPLPLVELPPGDYLVQVEATAGEHRERREAVFELSR